MLQRPIPPSPTLSSAGSDMAPAGTTVTAAPASPAKSGGIASHFGLYGAKKRLPAPPTISHKNHRHISDSARAEIAAIDQEIQAAFHNPDKAGSVATILTKLLDKPFFQHPSQIPDEEIVKLFAELDDCPIHPKDEEAESYAKKLIQDYTALQKQYLSETTGIADEQALEETIKDYLKSNRSTKASFENKFITTVDKDSSKYGSAQKMALETFAKAFPFTVSNDKNHLNVLKKLIATLPNLAHHPIIERNAQRRGLRVLEKALGGLPPDDVAETLVHLMKGISDLSQKLSRRKANFMGLTMQEVSGGMLVPAVIGEAILAGAIPPLAVIPPVATALLLGGAIYLDVRKQPQGTALHMLKAQLAALRKDWSKLSPDNQRQLTDAFKNLQASYTEFLGTKTSTLRQFFNDSFIDPANFPVTPNPVSELRKRVRHSIITPLTSRLTPLVNTTVSHPGCETATAEQKNLVDLLIRYHNEAKRAGVPDTEFPTGFLNNFIETTRAPEFENAAALVHRAFSRVKEMAEYRNQNSKARLLRKIVEITNRLAVGDETFVRDFASTCRLAEADCHNNVRQIFKALTYSVIADKALKGEEGLDDEGKLLALGRGFFHEQELKAATREVITHKRVVIPAEDKQSSPPPAGSEVEADNARAGKVVWERIISAGIEVEVGNAVEIALGRKFGIPEPIQGMGYTDTVTPHVTPQKLLSVQQNIEKRISDKQAFVDFLMNWTPLTKKITESADFKKEVDEKISEEYDKFDLAQDTYFDIKEKREPTAEEAAAFEAAGVAYQIAERETATHVLRAAIERLVDSHAAGSAPENETMPTSAGTHTDMAPSAHAGHEIQEIP